MIAKKYIVSGRVQGVNYRYFVNRTAHALGLKGYVKNLWDGRVEVYAEGEEALISKLEEKLKIGPELARVTDLEIIEEILQSYTDFKITY